MPIYGQQKTKTMVRSVLPSRARKTAKKRKDGLHRQNRHVIDNELRNLRGAASDVIEDYEFSDTDYEYYGEPHRTNWGGYDDIVYDRRGADHLNHFERWVYAKTKDMRPEDRYRYVKSTLSGALGTHAMSHLYWLKHDPLRPDEFDNRFAPGFRMGYWNNAYREFIKNRNASLEAALRGIARNNRERNKFNDYMHKHAAYDVHYKEVLLYTTVFHSTNFYKMDKKLEKVEFFGARTLNGYHDVTKFMRDVIDAQSQASSLGYRPSWMKSACEYFGIEHTYTRK